MNEEQMLEVLKGNFDLDLPAFKKWNPDMRHTKAKRHWFALSFDWDTDPKIEQLSDYQKLLWLKLLSLRASSESGLIGIRMQWVNSRMAFGGGWATIRGVVKLWKLGLITVRQNCPDMTDRTGQDISAPIDAMQVLPEILTKTAEPFLKKVSIEKQRVLIENYGADRVRNAALDAAEWCNSKGARGQKKNWGAFLGNWLKRDLAQSAPANQPKKKSVGVTDEMMDMLIP